MYMQNNIKKKKKKRQTSITNSYSSLFRKCRHLSLALEALDIIHFKPAAEIASIQERAVDQLFLDLIDSLTNLTGGVSISTAAIRIAATAVGGASWGSAATADRVDTHSRTTKVDPQI